MSITIRCEATETEYDLGYSEFLKLRTIVAEIYDPEWGSKYSDFFYNTKCDGGYFAKCIAFDKMNEEYAENHPESKVVIIFCMQPDFGGWIDYESCEAIYEKIKDFGYGDNTGEYVFNERRKKPLTLKAFSSLLLECVNNKCNLIWGR